MKCFYHVDADGKAAGFMVYQAEIRNNLYTKDYEPNKEDYRPFNYGWDFPFDDIGSDETVYLVDISLELDDMRKLLDITKNVIWIDHHISAIKKYENFEYDIKGLRYDGIAGCELTYAYLFIMTQCGKGEPIEFKPEYVDSAPKFIKLIGDRDVWKFRYGEKTNYFHIAFEAEYNTEPYDEFWRKLAISEVELERLILHGKIMKQYKDSYGKAYAFSKGFDTVFEGLSTYAINIASGFADSSIFSDIDSDKYDLFMIFSYNGEIWTYTIYPVDQNKVDASEIATKYGGGGHRGAAGFRSNELLVSKKTKE